MLSVRRICSSGNCSFKLQVAISITFKGLGFNLENSQNSWEIWGVNVVLSLFLWRDTSVSAVKNTYYKAWNSKGLVIHDTQIVKYKKKTGVKTVFSVKLTINQFLQLVIAIWFLLWAWRNVIEQLSERMFHVFYIVLQNLWDCIRVLKISYALVLYATQHRIFLNSWAEEMALLFQPPKCCVIYQHIWLLFISFNILTCLRNVQFGD